MAPQPLTRTVETTTTSNPDCGNHHHHYSGYNSHPTPLQWVQQPPYTTTVGNTAKTTTTVGKHYQNHRYSGGKTVNNPLQWGMTVNNPLQWGNHGPGRCTRVPTRVRTVPAHPLPRYPPHHHYPLYRHFVDPRPRSVTHGPCLKCQKSRKR